MQTASDYKKALIAPRLIRLNGKEYSHPLESASLKLGFDANLKFYKESKNEAYQTLLSKPGSNNKHSKHPFFEVTDTVEDLNRCADIIDFMQDKFHGLYTRSPDYKGSFITCLASNSIHFGEHADTAKKWHEKIASNVPVMSHAFVAPSSLGSHDLQSMRGLEVISSDTKGIVIRGLKAVSTGATAAQYVYVRDSRPTVSGQFGLCFITPLSTKNLKLICTQSITTDERIQNRRSYPISSVIDENDTMLFFDDVFIPYENIFCAEELDNTRWHKQQEGFIQRARLHGVIRVLRKLELILGFLVIAAPRMKPANSHTKDIISAVELARQILHGLKLAMLQNPTELETGELLPNVAASSTAYIMAPKLLTSIREKLAVNFAGPLISVPSSSDDLTNDEIYRLWGKDGSADIFESSIGYIRGIRELVLGEFGVRQELFEANYLGGSGLAYNDLFDLVRQSPETSQAIDKTKLFFEKP